MATNLMGTGAAANEVTATAGDILTGKTANNSDGDVITGTMTNRGAWTGSVNPGGSVTVPAGYHNGSGKVSANEYTYSTVYLGQTSGRWGGTISVDMKEIIPNKYTKISRSNFYAVPYQAITDSGMTGSLTTDQGDHISYNASSGTVSCSSTHYGTGGQVHGWLHYKLYVTY